MATTTTNLGLTKPIGTEKALVSVINGNMDIIDNKVGAIPQNESVQSQITALNNQVAQLATDLKTSGVVSAGTDTTIMDQYIVKTGNVVSIRCQPKKTSGNFAEDEVIGVVVDAYKPKRDTLLTIAKYGANSAAEYAMIKTNGNIIVWSKNTAQFNGAVQVFGTYILP